MFTGNILFSVLLLFQYYESLADIGKNSSFVGNSKDAVDQCHGLCNQIKPILSHIRYFQPVRNKEVTGVNIFENRLKNMKAQLAAFETSKRKPKPDLAKFIKIGSKYYYIDEMNKLNWFAASKACREMGGKLAVIQDENELKEITSKERNLFEYLTEYWIGINALVEEEYFKIWPSSENNFNETFLKWFHDASTHYYRCVTLCQYLFLDLDCNENHYFICEAVIGD